MSNKERQSAIAVRLNCMGFISINPETGEQTEFIDVGKPIVMRLRKGKTKLLIDVDGVIKDVE